MSSPLIVIIVLIILDLILKSSKEKKQIKNEQQKTNSRTNTLSKSIDLSDLKEALNREIQGQKKKDKHKNIDIENQNTDLIENREITLNFYKDEKTINKKEVPIGKEIHMKEKDQFREDKRQNLKKDLIKGLIFSEILSEPKGLRKKQ